MRLASEALDRQVGLIELFDGPLGGPTVEWLMTTVRTRGGDWEGFAHHIANEMQRAETYAITAEMLDVVHQGSTTMGDGLPLNLDLQVPSPSGFIWFEEPRPWRVLHTAGETLDPDAEIMEVSGLWWFTFDAIQAQPDIVKPGIITGIMVNRERVEGIEGVQVEYVPRWFTYDITVWAADLDWVEVTDDAEFIRRWDDGESGILSEAGALWRKWLLAFWALCNDWVEVVPAERSSRRRAQRTLGAAPDYGQIRLITLRRSHHKHPTDGGTETPWSHRWWVNGHWRLQPHGPGRTLRRLQWIAPYVKGPEDRPLIVRDDVKVVRR